MTDTANQKNLDAYVDRNPPKRDAVGILRRVFGALIAAMDESRRRQAEREFAYFVVRQGGRMTDELEREMTRRWSTSDWSLRA